MEVMVARVGQQRQPVAWRARRTVPTLRARPGATLARAPQCALVVSSMKRTSQQKVVSTCRETSSGGTMTASPLST